MVPYSDHFNYTTDTFAVGTSGAYATRSETFPITVNPTVANSSYIIETQPNTEAFLTDGLFPVWGSSGYFFYNESFTEKVISIKGNLKMASDGTSTFSVYAVICVDYIPFDPKYTVSLLPTVVNNIVQNVDTTFEINKRISIPPTGKVWIVATSTNDAIGANNIIIQPMNFDFDIIKDKEIEIIESSFNDTYNLITNSNGRPSVIDENAAKTYFPTVIRFGQAYQSNTNLNATNRFYYEDFDEYDRTFGDVMRLHVRDRYLKVFQQFKVGNVPILTQIVKDVTGNPLQANSNQLINKIQYYAGNYGIGDAATSLAWNNFADYFVDNFRGVVCRLSQNGIEPISILYNTNAFFVATTAAYRKSLNNGFNPDGVYTGDPCIYGVFDANTNKYIIAMEEINRYNANCDFNGGSAVMIPYQCEFNGGSAVMAPYYCDFNGGSAVVFTPPPGDYDYYLADEYMCDFPGCTLTQTNMLVAFPAGFSYIGSHYYSDLYHTGLVYKITSSTTIGIAVLLDTIGSNATCNLACSV